MATQLDIANTVALVSIASLVIDRLGSGVLLVFSLFKTFPNPPVADPEAQARAEKKLRLASWGVAAVLSAVVVFSFEPIRILAVLGVKASPRVDEVLTILILASGADFVRSVLGVKGPAEVPPEPKPLQVTGKLVLEEADKKTLGAAA